MTETYTPSQPTWCAGCGHYGVQGALTGALSKLGVPAHETMLLAGIGCSGSVQNNIEAYGYHAMHGRVLPTAVGAAVANPDLTVIAAGGDGDGYAIGAGHLVHALKRNASVLYILMNNGTYGLTKGQDSPTAEGPLEAPIDGILLGLAISGSTFLARASTRFATQLDDLMVQALEHVRAKRGFAFLEVLSPCVTYNDTYPDWDARLFNLEDVPEFDCTDRSSAFAAVQRLKDRNRIPAGLCFQAEWPAFEEPWIEQGLKPADLARHDPAHHGDRFRDLMSSYLV